MGKLINAAQPTIAFGISSSDTDIALLYELALFISFTLCFCFSDVLTSGIWSDAAALEDPLLRSLVPDLLDLQLGSRAPSTLTRYKSGWLRWRGWASSKIGVPVLPAKPLHIALFITELTNVCLANNTGVSPIETVVYGIQWAHSMAGLEVCPVNHPLVKSSLEGAKRKLARPVRPKEPLSVDTVQAIADFYVSSNSLATLRFLFVLLVGFYGFFRIDEINSFCLQDVTIKADHMSIYVAKRKNDQYREGHTSCLVRSGKSTCPVSITERIIKVLSQSNPSFPLVRRIVRSKSGEYFHASKGVSISTLREEFKKYIQPFVDDVAKYGTHSMRSGAASNPACRRIPGDLLDMHAGWRCPSSKNRYIKHTMEDRLSVSKSLLL